MIIRRGWISNNLLIVGLAFHEVLAVISYGGQVPLLSSKSYSLRASSAAAIFEPGAAVSSGVKASQDARPNVDILEFGAEPQQPTGQIAWNHHHPQPQQQPTKTEVSHDGAPLSSTDRIGGSSLHFRLSVTQEEMAVKKRAFIAAISSLLGYITLNELYHHFSLAGQEDAHWIATSNSWLDRKTCQWFSICGASHLQSHIRIGGHTQRKTQEPLKPGESWRSGWTKSKSKPDDWSDDERVLREIPGYVFDYAPLVHLYSGEQFWPGDIAEHLIHTTPHLNYTPVQARSDHPNLTNLNDLNRWNRGSFVYLTSDDNVEDRPEWLGGKSNIPKAPPLSAVDEQEDVSWTEWNAETDNLPPEDIEDAGTDWPDVGHGSFQEQGGERPNPDKMNARATNNHLNKPAKGGRSDAPAVLVVVDKGHGVVDAFWFYFYSYNLGNVVLNVRFGNHVGDWEHSMVRFHHGQPKAVFLSEHSFGEAYTYEAVEKIGRRPVIYSATGTHAMYATPGRHPYVLPLGLLHDETDRGPLWDPLLNSHAYTYDYLNDTLRSSNVTPHAPTEWFYFRGRWGDKYYPLSDSRQYRFAGQYHYVTGPLGPRFKNLGRKKVCQGDPNDPCVIKKSLDGHRRAKRWQGVGTGEEMSEEPVKRFVRPEDQSGEE